MEERIGSENSRTVRAGEQCLFPENTRRPAFTSSSGFQSLTFQFRLMSFQLTFARTEPHVCPMPYVSLSPPIEYRLQVPTINGWPLRAVSYSGHQSPPASGTNLQCFCSKIAS